VAEVCILTVRVERRQQREDDQNFVSAPAIGERNSVRQRCRESIALLQHRGLLLIHASTHLDYRARRDPRIKALPENELIFGHLIGLVTLVDCVTESNSQWADRSARWKLVLANPTRLSRPVPGLGSLNLFEVDERLVRDLLPPGILHELPPGTLPLHVSQSVTSDS
jgi:hypothetical protein